MAKLLHTSKLRAVLKRKSGTALVIEGARSVFFCQCEPNIFIQFYLLVTVLKKLAMLRNWSSHQSTKMFRDTP